MRAGLRNQLLTAGIILPLMGIVSCEKPAPVSVTQNSPEPSLAPPSELAKPVPRRAVPIIVTNQVSMTAPPPEPVSTNTPPAIRCGPAQSFPCGPIDGIQAVVAVHVEDADGDHLSVTWSIDGRDRFTQQVATNGPPTSADLTYAYTFTPGEHAVKVTVSDGELSTFCDTTVTVQRDAQEPVITCPGDIIVATDPGHCSAVVNFNVKASDNCPDVTLVCDPPSGSAFPIGTTAVRCTATDGAGNVATCSFAVVVRFTNRCPQSDASWRQNIGGWPVNSLVLGDQVYSKSQLISLLRANAPADASIALARQLIAASLNTAMGSDPRPICGELNEAHDLLRGFSGKLPFHVNLAVPAARPMMRLSTVLGSYNAGLLTANCVP